jgi:hypothetical protein
VLGAFLGLSLGLAGGLARRSSRAGIAAGLLGMVLGGVLGAGLSLAGSPLFFKAKNQFEDQQLILGLVLHGVIWGAIGAVGGLAFGQGLGVPGLRRHTVLGGLLGALIGTAIADFAGGAFFPLGGADQPISETWMTRVMSCLLVGIFVGLGIARSIPSTCREVKTPTVDADA